MNQKQRQEYIAEIVKIKGSITTAEIVEELNISKMTAGRDLKELETLGIVVLFHGGAMYKDSNILEYPMSVKSDLFVSEKKRIGKAAAELIEDEQVVFLETGTTVLYAAFELINKRTCSYYTNSLLVMNHLSKAEGLNLYSVPGKFRELSKGFLGMETQNYVNDFCFDICIIGAEGIDSSGRVSLYNDEDAFTKRAIMANSKKKMLLFDGSKVGKNYPYGIGEIGDFDFVLTDYKDINHFLHNSERNLINIIPV